VSHYAQLYGDLYRRFHLVIAATGQDALIRDLEADVEWVRRVRASAGGQP
jgi:hypothetical protein